MTAISRPTKIVTSNGVGFAAGSGAVNYFTLAQMSAISNGTVGSRQRRFRTAGTLSYLFAVKGAGDRTGMVLKTYQAAAGNGAIAFTSTNGLYEDTSGTDAVTVPQVWSLQLTGGSGGTTTLSLYSAGCTWKATGTTTTVMGTCTNQILSGSSTVYSSPGMVSSPVGTRAGNEWLVKLPAGVTGVTIKNLYVYVSSYTSGSQTVTIDGATGSGTSPTVTLNATGVFEDTTNSIVAKDGDLITAKIVGAPGSMTVQMIVWEVQSDDGVNFLVAGYPNGTGSTTVHYTMPGALQFGSSNMTTEANAQIPIRSTDKASLLSTYTNVKAASTVGLRANSGNAGTPSQVSVSQNIATGWNTDTTNAYTLAATDLIDFVQTASTPAPTISFVALTLYTPPRTGSLTADAVLKNTQSGTLTADAVIKATLSGTFTADAVLQRAPATFYISPTGNDSTGDGSIGNPWASLYKFYAQAVPGDTLYARGGTYSGAGLNMTTSYPVDLVGDASHVTSVLAYPGETPIFDGGSSGSSGCGIWFRKAQYHRVSGLQFQNFTPTSSGVIVVGATGGSGQASHITLSGLKVTAITGLTANEHGIYLSNYSDNVTVRGCELVGSYPTTSEGAGIEIYHTPATTSFLIERNLIRGWTQGIQVWDDGSVNTGTIRHNTIVGCYNKIDARFHGAITVVDNAGDALDNLNFYDPNNSASTTASNNYWGLTFYSDYTLPPGTNSASDGTQAGRFQSGSFTADAVLKKTASGSFTADAFLTASLTTVTGSFTADAVLKKTQSGSFTADSVLKATQSGTFTADAVLKATQAGTLTADSVLLKTQSGTFTADSVLKKTQTGTVTADSVLKATQSASFTADAYMVSRVTGSLTADAVLRATVSGSFTADSYLASRVTASLTADAVLKATQSSSLTADAVLKKTLSGSITADAVLVKTASGSFTADSAIKATLSGSLTADAVLKGTQAGSLTADAVLQGTQAGTFTASATLKATQNGSFLADAVLQKTQSGYLTADSVILSTLTGSLTADSLLLAVRTGSVTADAVIKSTQVGSLTADAMLARTVSGSFTANAFIVGFAISAEYRMGDQPAARYVLDDSPAARYDISDAPALVLADDKGRYEMDDRPAASYFIGDHAG